jgi:hypothetical protein
MVFTRGPISTLYTSIMDEDLDDFKQSSDAESSGEKKELEPCRYDEKMSFDVNGPSCIANDASVNAGEPAPNAESRDLATNLIPGNSPQESIFVNNLIARLENFLSKQDILEIRNCCFKAVRPTKPDGSRTTKLKSDLLRDIFMFDSGSHSLDLHSAINCLEKILQVEFTCFHHMHSTD